MQIGRYINYKYIILSRIYKLVKRYSLELLLIIY